MMSCRTPPAVDDHRLRIARLRVGRQCAPDLGAGELVERHHLGVRRTADQGDEPLAVHQRRAGNTPGRDLGVVLLDVVAGPQQLPGIHAQRAQHAGGAERVHAVAVHGGRGARPGRPGARQARVVRLPLVLPQDVAAQLVDADNPLDHVVRADVPRVDDEYAAFRHRRSRVPLVHRHPPVDLQARLRKRLDDARLGPHAAAVGAAPLRPVFGVQLHAGCRQARQTEQHRRQSPRHQPYGASCVWTRFLKRQPSAVFTSVSS